MDRGILLPSGARFFGYQRDKLRNRLLQRPVQELLAQFHRDTAIPTSATLAEFVPCIFDQGRTGSCGGHGTAGGIATSAASAGIDLGFIPSPLSSYRVTRMLERVPDASGKLPELTDSGVMPTDLMTDVSSVGIRPMTSTPGVTVSGLVATTPDGRVSDVWGPDDGPAPPNVNAEEDFGMLQQDGKNIVVGEYRIDETASNAYDLTAATVGVAKRTVGVGMFVDSKFMEWKAGDPPIDSIDLNDPNGGGHWLYTDGFAPVSSSSTLRAFELVNSWSKDYGQGGKVLVTENALRQAASDLIAWSIRLGKLGAGRGSVLGRPLR